MPGDSSSSADVVVLSDSDADSPPAPKRDRRCAPKRPDFLYEPSCSSASPRRRRTPKSAARAQTRTSRQSAGQTSSAAEASVGPQSASEQGSRGDEKNVLTSLNAAVLPGLKVRMPWCVTCESLAGAPCFDDHELLGMKLAVSKAARDLGAKRDAVAGELLRAQEALQTLRTWTVAAETRQDVAALRACTASLGDLQRALAQFVQTVHRPEAAAGPAEPERPGVDEDSSSDSHLVVGSAISLASANVDAVPEEHRVDDASSSPIQPDVPLPPEESADSEDVPAFHVKEERAEDDREDTTSTVDFIDATRESPEPPVMDALPAAELKREQESEDDAAARDQTAAEVPRVYLPEESLDVAQESEHQNYAPALDFTNPSLDMVRRLDGVNCHRRSDWCRALLQRVAPRVEWLYVFEAFGDHLEVIRDMPALLYLHVHVCHVDGGLTPDLPLQLRELTVENVTAQHFASLHRMPHLRKLCLDWCDDPIDVTSPPLPPHHRGLQWLWVALRPASTALSLAKAHAATLQELRLLCASEGGTPWHFVDLGSDLRQCELVALRRVILLRGPAPDFPKDRLPHTKKSCKSQKQLVRAGLLALRLVRPSPARVAVLCDVCDKVPTFPDLGDFTWID